jgi:methylenetetrahydrofolate--tRNA-(uracil-5-)-methyltransferase
MHRPPRSSRTGGADGEPLTLTIIGGGLAGCEAAWQAAERGIDVVIHEMRPVASTPAHRTDQLGELVCSNSLRSDDPETGVGTLKEELRALGSLVLRLAEANRVPAGRSLAVDRDAFAAELTRTIASHPRIRLERGEVDRLPDPPAIIATGPLTSPRLVEAIRNLFGAEALSFYDAIAPIVDATTLAEGSFFAASRYEESDDYLNIPLDEPTYKAFIAELVAAQVKLHLEEERCSTDGSGAAANTDVGVGRRNFFEGCLPIEEMARRGEDTPRFGPMKPVGLTDPKTGREAYAIIQLRKEDLSGRCYNLVGFQTQLSIPDQERILRMIPALASATLLRHGSAHRNTFIDSPAHLSSDLSARAKPGLRFAGQMAGVEGYVESTACGLLAGLYAAVPGLTPPPTTTVIGGLLRYVTASKTRPFQPMKANWGVVDEIAVKKKKEKKPALAERSRIAIAEWIQTQSLGINVRGQGQGHGQVEG